MEPQSAEPQASDCLLHAGRHPSLEEAGSPARQAPLAAPRPSSVREHLQVVARRLPVRALAVGGALVVAAAATVWVILPRAVSILGHAAATHGLSLGTITSQEVKPLRGMLTMGGGEDELNPCYTRNRAYNPIDMMGAIPLSASSPEECQERCKLKSGCKYFSFDHVSTLCHLEDESATMGTVFVTFIAGPALCPTTKTTTATATTATATTVTTTTVTTTEATTVTTTEATTTTATTVTTTEASTVTTTTSATIATTARATTLAPTTPAATEPPARPSARPSARPPTQTPTAELRNYLPTLFCFMMAMSTGYEPDLVRQQVARYAGIFDCRLYQVFSTSTLDLGRGVVTRAIGVDLSKKGAWGSWLNTENFLQAWDTILSEGKYESCDWTVKADPDAVFMADRLQLHLKQSFPEGTAGSFYVKNCPKSFGLMGSLEVFSKAAVKTFGGHRVMCRARFHPADSGEDGYMQACMEGSGVVGKEDFTLLVDGYCGFGSCSDNHWNVAFHPYKDAASWFQCWDQVVAAR